MVIKHQGQVTYHNSSQPLYIMSRLYLIILMVFDRPVIDQNFYYAGLKFTSPTFSCAISNMLPAMTFVMAVIFRYAIYSNQNHHN
jgi:drug/metabolite transporter (DMT)-like permease